MTWSEKELFAEAESLVTGAEQLRQTGASFARVSAAMSTVSTSNVLSREAGLGIGPTGPHPEIAALVEAIVADTDRVGTDLAGVADNVERAAREFLRVDDESAQSARRLQARVEQDR